MSEQDSRAQHNGRDWIRAEIDVPPTPPDPNRPLPIPETPPAPPTPTDEPPPEPVEDPPAEPEPKPPYTVGGNSHFFVGFKPPQQRPCQAEQLLAMRPWL
jgi:hypothetical protein